MPFEILIASIVLIANLAQALLFLTGFFYLFLGFRGLFKSSCVPDGAAPARFAVLVPAHNEEKVIRFAIESLKNLNYPADKFDVFLVADHCTDATVRVAEKAGALILDYCAPDLKAGKGRALKWATEKVLALNHHEAICCFDADSLAHPDFLSVMNNHLSRGEEVIQGRQLAKNTECWLARILAAGHIVTNRFFQAPKYSLGLSATLHGKGMCFSRTVAAAHAWDETCLTEDLEMQMRLIRSGVLITWARDAIVYDEEPVTLRQYVSRNVRWTRGSLDTARRHLTGLLSRAVRMRDIRAFEGALYSAQTYRIAVIAALSLIIYLTHDRYNLFLWLYRSLPGAELTIKFAALVPIFMYPAIALILEKAGPKLFLAYFLQPVLGVLRVPVFIAGVFRERGNWGRTEHASQVAIGDLLRR